MEEQKDKQLMGSRLAFLRRYHKLTQVKLAGILGCSQKYISDWESGRRWIPTKYLLKIIREFDIDLDYFHPDKLGPDKFFVKQHDRD